MRLSKIASSLLIAVAIALPGAAVAQSGAAPPPYNQTTGPATRPQLTPDQVARDNWHSSMLQSSKLPHGCARTTYPSDTWQEIPCGTAPATPIGRPHAADNGKIAPQFQGGGDYVVSVPGSLTQLSGLIAPVGALEPEVTTTGLSDAYSLQINTNLFNDSFCPVGGGCRAWEQFVYVNTPGNLNAYIQYWLINYTPTPPQTAPCPTSAPWNYSPAQMATATTAATAAGCYRDGPKIPHSSLPVSGLADLTLEGMVDASGNDFLVLSNGEQMTITAPNGSILGLSSNWQQAEFNIFGENAGDSANFNAGGIASLKVVADWNPGTIGSATCIGGGNTAEGNNFTLQAPCTQSSVNGSTEISFNESVPPTIQSISPTSGSQAGGTTVDVVGTGFIPTTPANGNQGLRTQILYSTDRGLTPTTCDSTTHCTSLTPPSPSPAPIETILTAQNATSAALGAPSTTFGAFNYVLFPTGTLTPLSGPTSGNTQVTMNGVNLSVTPGATQIEFDFSTGAVPAQNVACSNLPGAASPEQTCTFTTPPLSPAGDGPVAVPMTVAVAGNTTQLPSFTYGPQKAGPPPTLTCHQCEQDGGTCETVNGKFICKGNLR